MQGTLTISEAVLDTISLNINDVAKTQLWLG
jgi:hypothetical protein